MASYVTPHSPSFPIADPSAVSPAIPRYIIPDLPSAIEILPFLQRIDANRWYSNFGPLVTEFEQKFSATMAAAHQEPERSTYSFAASTGYHALAIGLKLLGVKAGDKVLLPAVTFPACPLSVQHIGAEPVLSDVDPHSWTLTPVIARAAAAKMPLAAVMPVAVYGIPLDATAWDEFTRDTGIPVLIDAAAAVESQRYLAKGLVVHSLHALKPFGIGEGGLLVSRREDDIYAARMYANFGTWERITYNAGENAKLSEMHAAVALAQLQRWGEVKRRRAHIYQQFVAAVRPHQDKMALHAGLDQAIVSCLMFQLKQPYDKDLLTTLRQQGIFAHHTYLPPLYRHPYFEKLTVVNGAGEVRQGGDSAQHMLVAEQLNRTVIGLPFHAFLSAEEITHSVAALAAAVSSR